MTHRRWYVLALALAVAAGLMGVRAYAEFSASPRQYVAQHYSRSGADDIGDDALAYRSDRLPTTVAAGLEAAFGGTDRYVDGSGVYLRYPEDAVIILPRGTGSLILVERLVTAYPRYASTVGGYWGWGRGDTGRGGGPGGGK